MLDLQKLLLLSIKYWWVYLISIFVCLILAGVYYVTTPASYNVDASLMLRQLDYGRQDNTQAKLLNMMGGGDQKMVMDEVRVLSSRSLFEPIIEEMGLTVTCKERDGFKWVNSYPECPLEVQVTQPLLQPIRSKVKIKNGICSISNADSLAAAGVQVRMKEGAKDGAYRLTVNPLLQTLAFYQKNYEVTRDNRESNIINISTISTCPALAIDVINRMLDNYNAQTAMDKNILAIQTDKFLNERLDVISAELTQAENDLQEYKRTHHIADLANSAEDYRRSTVEYDKQMAHLEAQISVLDYTEKEISKEENKRKVFPYVDKILSVLTESGVPSALTSHIAGYNASIAHLNSLLTSVDEDHPLVQLELEQIEQKRQNILTNIAQNRMSSELQRASLIKQKKDFQNRLEDIPEQNRTYRELQRITKVKENQYLYLISRREENSMLMVSASIPAIIIDRAQMNPKKVSPKVSMCGAIAILLGLLLPALAFALKDVLADLLKLKNGIQNN